MLGAVAAASWSSSGGGSTHALIPLYAVGVFIDFTISQSGMVRHWLTTKDQGWRYRLTINAIGAVLTAVIADRGDLGEVHVAAPGSSSC